MQKLPDFVPALSHDLKPLMRDGSQFTCMLFHPRDDGRIALDRAVESQHVRSHRRSSAVPHRSAGCYWAASRAAQKAHLWLVAKAVSCTGDGGISDRKLPSTALNCCHAGRPEPLGVPDL